MTRDGDGPRKGDRVRWTRLRPYVVEGVLEEVRHDAYCIRDDEGRLRACQTEDVTVEVLERSDDPSKNLVGTVRREQHPEDDTGQGYSVWQHVEFQVSATKTGSHWVCTHSTHHGNLGESLTHDQVRGMPVIGAAPGTPAAEAQTVGIGQTLPDGYSSWAEYHEKHPFVPSSRPYKSYLSEHGEARQPRTFRSDGPEPPPDVAALRSPLRPDGHVLKRCEHGGWLWTGSPQAPITDVGLPWPATARGTLREVLPS